MKKIIIRFMAAFILLMSMLNCHENKSEALDSNLIYIDSFKPDDNVVYQYNKSTKEMVPYYIVPSPDKCRLNGTVVDPNGKFMALVCYCRISDEEDCRKTVRGLIRVHLIDIKKKKLIKSFDRGRFPTFSPDGGWIVISEYDAGLYFEGCRPPRGYNDYNMFIYDIKKKRKVTIDLLGVLPRDYSWSEHDGNIYITDRTEVVRYNVSEAKSEKVGIKAIHYSPDGKYYFGAVDPVFFRVSDNQPMREWNDKIREYGRCSFVAWALGGRAVILSSNKPQQNTNFVFDMERGEVIQKFYGSVRSCNREGTECIFTPLYITKDLRVTLKTDAIEIVKIKEAIRN
jgi:hypothetical protein